MSLPDITPYSEKTSYVISLLQADDPDAGLLNQRIEKGNVMVGQKGYVVVFLLKSHGQFHQLSLGTSLAKAIDNAENLHDFRSIGIIPICFSRAIPFEGV